MSEIQQQPEPEDMDALVFTNESVDAPEAPNPGDVMVARTFRLPVELDWWLTQEAQAKGVSRSEILRTALEFAHQTFGAMDRPVSLADVIGALAQVPTRTAA
jgi:hypothetical protein